MPMSPGMGAGLATGAGAIAGAFPDTTSKRSSGRQNSNQDVTSNSLQHTDMNTLLNYFTNVFGKQNTTTSSSSTPTLTPETQQFMNQLIGRFGAQAAPSLTGYGAAQTANINANSEAQRQAVNNIMASRGLSTSPVAGTSEAGIEQNRVNQITGMQQQLPILKNQMDLQNLNAAGNFFSQIPKGMATTGTTAMDSSQMTDGGSSNYVVGDTTNAGHQYTEGTQMNQSDESSKSGGGLGGAISTGMGAFMQLLPLLMMSDKKLKTNIKVLPQEKAIEKIRALKAATWDWKADNKTSSGVIAQDLEKVLPHLVHQVGNPNKEGESLKAVNYGGLIPYLIGAVQNLDSRIEVAK